MTHLCRGLGALIAEKFAEEGCNVAINYNASKDSAEMVAERVGKQHGVKTAVIQAVLLLDAETFC